MSNLHFAQLLNDIDSDQIPLRTLKAAISLNALWSTDLLRQAVLEGWGECRCFNVTTLAEDPMQELSFSYHCLDH